MAYTKALTLVKSELQKRHTCTDLGELRSYLGLHITWDRAQRTITVTQSHMVHQVLQRSGFQYSSPQLTPLSTSHSLSAPPSDESVEPSGPYPELVGCLMYLMTCTRLDLAYPLSLLARYVAPGRHRKVDDSATQRSSHGYTFSLGSGLVSWRSTCSSSFLSSSCDAEIYAGAMAAQELRSLTYLLTDLGEQPRSPPVLYVDNKAMIALCQEHRLEHRTKHIALRYFLARELQQRGQLRLAYVATWANTADVFTKALPPAIRAVPDGPCVDSPVLGRPLPQMASSWTTILLTAPPPGLQGAWGAQGSSKGCSGSSRAAGRTGLQGSRAHRAAGQLGARDRVELIEVADDSGGARGAEPAGAGPGGAEPGVAESEGAEPEGAETECVEPGGAEPECVDPGGAGPGGAESGGAEPGGAEPGVLSLGPLSPHRLREWYAWRCRRAAGATGPAGAGAARAAGPGGTGAVGGARTGGTGAAGAGGAAGVGAVGAGAVATRGTGAGDAMGVVAGDPGAEGTGAVSAFSGGAARPRLYYVLLLQQVLGLPPSTGPNPPLLSPPTVQSQLGLTEHREPESRPVSPESRPASPARTVRAGRVSRPRLPPVPSTHSMTLRLSTAPQRSTAASALVAELVQFAAACRLDYAASLVAESESASVCPPSIGGECALGTDVFEDRQEEFECFSASLPHPVSMLLAPEGDPNAPEIPTPRSYADAIEGPYSSQWQTAMDTEMASWKSTGTYVDEVPTRGTNIVSGMWIFRVKQPPGSPPIFKARYVAQGFSLRQGVEFFHTFFPTPKMTTLRVLLHVAAQRDYELHSLDFSTAFLQGSLHEEIWLRRPPGFTRSFPPGTQWSLRRLVYGLRQAPREWHDTLRMTLAALRLAPSTADPSLFLRTDTTLPPFYVLVYVDNLVFATADSEALAHVKSELQKRHTCTNLGALTSYLGLRITRDRAQRTITLTQSHMVQQVLQRFGFTSSSPQSTPLPTGHSLSAPPSDESVEPSGPYPELVGCLMYLMIYTRPDLAYPLSILARYVTLGRHRKEHMDAANRVLRYWCSTSGMGLVLGGRARFLLTCHADASWVDDLATQRSSQGYTFSLGSGSLSWRSTRSSSVLSSSCEAEIYAGAMAAQEICWLTYLLIDLGEPPRSPPVLYVDNKAMIALCQEHRLEHRTKHIALRYFLARELQQRGQLRLAYVATRANTADVFTKALQPCNNQRFCTVLGLVPTVPHLLTS
ncbi:unnamed protein product [Closterium sp. NIES-54]